MASSGQVLVRSWPSVLALTTPRVSGKVDIAHRMIQDTSADLPMPWPEATALRTASPASCTPLPSATRMSSCQGSGPFSGASAVPSMPQGKAYMT